MNVINQLSLKAVLNIKISLFVNALTEAVLSNSKFFRESEKILKTLTNATLSCLEAVMNKTMPISKTIFFKKENLLLIRYIAFRFK